VKMLTFDASLTDFINYRKSLPKNKFLYNERKINRRGQQNFLQKTNITTQSFRISNKKNLINISDASNTVDFIIHSLS
jgi:hypothetical protein